MSECSNDCHQDCYDAPGQQCRHPGPGCGNLPPQGCYEDPAAGQHCRHPGPRCGKHPPRCNEVPAPCQPRPHPGPGCGKHPPRCNEGPTPCQPHPHPGPGCGMHPPRCNEGPTPCQPHPHPGPGCGKHPPRCNEGPTPCQPHPHPGPGCGMHPPRCNEGPTPCQPHPHPEVEWIRATPQQAATLSQLAVVGGYEGDDLSPLWIIRAIHQGDMVPGKLRIKEQEAYVPWGGQEHKVHDIEVCCTRTQKISWQESKGGVIPPNAIVAGHTSSGEKLYVGRAQEQGNLTPGKVHPTHEGLFISYAGKEIKHNVYEIMCHNNNI